MPTAQAALGEQVEFQCCSPEDEGPMTMHVILPTLNQGLVWVTETLFSLGNGNISKIEKIIYLENKNIAVSAWGTNALLARDRFVERIEDGSIAITPTNIVQQLKQFALDVQAEMKFLHPPGNANHPNLLIATFFEEDPRVYQLLITSIPQAYDAQKYLIAGDDYNPSNIFVDYYYHKKTARSKEESLFLGIHCMRLAHTLKTAYIGEPNAWFYANGKFEHLPDDQLAGYIKRSEALDRSILRAAKK